jgi:hypothetical protein
MDLTLEAGVRRQTAVVELFSASYGIVTSSKKRLYRRVLPTS